MSWLPCFPNLLKLPRHMQKNGEKLLSGQLFVLLQDNKQTRTASTCANFAEKKAGSILQTYMLTTQPGHTTGTQRLSFTPHFVSKTWQVILPLCASDLYYKTKYNILCSSIYSFEIDSQQRDEFNNLSESFQKKKADLRREQKGIHVCHIESVDRIVRAKVGTHNLMHTLPFQAEDVYTAILFLGCYLKVKNPNINILLETQSILIL